MRKQITLRYKDIINPFFIYITVTTLYIGLFMLYEIGVLDSFILSNGNVRPLGFFHLSLYILTQGLFLGIFSKIKLTSNLNKIKISLPIQLIYLLCLVFIFSSIYGLYFGILKQVNVSILSLNFWVLTMSNNFRANIIWGQGYTMLSNLAIIPLSISTYYLKRKKNFRILQIISFFIVFLSSFLYSSRLKIILAILIVVIPTIRKNQFNKKINLKLLIVIALIILSFLIWGGGVRASNNLMNNYTSSRFLWSFYTFTDYFISTTLFSTHALSDSHENIRGLHEIRNIISSDPIIHGYTNAGKFYNIYKLFNFGGFIYIFCQSFITVFSWKLYVLGNKLGILLYPLILYALLEGLRIDPFLTIDFILPVLLLYIISFFLD